MKKHFIIIAVVIVAIPVVLNFILPIKTGLNNLDGEGNPTIWLTFWGAYLAALGSFFLGVVSYMNNKDAVKQNEKILYNITLDHLIDRYNHLEKFIANEESHYNESYINKVIAIMKKCEDNNERLVYLYQQKQKITLTSLNIIRFLEQESASVCHNATEKALLQYGNGLKDANDGICDYIDALIRTIKNEQSNSFDLEKFMNENIIEKAIDSCNGLIDLGTDFLQAEKKRIRDYAKKHSIDLAIL